MWGLNVFIHEKYLEQFLRHDVWWVFENVNIISCTYQGSYSQVIKRFWLRNLPNRYWWAHKNIEMSGGHKTPKGKPQMMLHYQFWWRSNWCQHVLSGGQSLLFHFWVKVLPEWSDWLSLDHMFWTSRKESGKASPSSSTFSFCLGGGCMVGGLPQIERTLCARRPKTKIKNILKMLFKLRKVWEREENECNIFK